jgi:hypothetical protein
LLKEDSSGRIPFIETTMAPRTITKADRVSVYITAVRPPEILSYIQKPHINRFKWPDAV